MNNKDFLKELGQVSGLSTSEATSYSDAIVSFLSTHLADGDSISVSAFGTFDVKKKLERLVVNPVTKQRMMVPPKIVVNFKAYNSLKEKVNNRQID